MKQTVTLVVAAIVAAGCGGRESVASRSAAAYREVVEIGTPIADDHGGHAHKAADGHGQAAAHDHAGPAAGAVDHAAMGHTDAPAAHAGHTAAAGTAHGDHGAQAAAGAHAQHTSGSAAAHAGQAMPDHAAHGAAPHATRSPAGHGQPAPAGQAAHADHAAVSPALIPEGGLWGPVGAAAHHAGHPATAAAAPELPLAAIPSSNREMAAVAPSQTLRPDSNDAASPISVEEAAKSSAPAGEHRDH
ncbi:MAG TPA: hypothetical protein VNA04_15290 [Thermoanaerobaculia bacterium]|nr:hypothetical protein [Thermoanaerobaculia bacterium]